MTVASVSSSQYIARVRDSNYSNMNHFKYAFKDLMCDAQFRRLTFDCSLKYKEWEGKKLANNGLINTMMAYGNRRQFKLICCFCKFIIAFDNYESMKKYCVICYSHYPKMDKFDHFSIKLFHANRFPKCPLVISQSGLFPQNAPSENVIFKDVFEYYGLISSFLKVWDEKYQWLGPKFQLENLSPRMTTNQTLFKCLICLKGLRDFYIKNCEHLIMCQICANSLRIDKCPLCKQPIDAFSRAILPKPKNEYWLTFESSSINYLTETDLGAE
jgi:hypothetical protein